MSPSHNFTPGPWSIGQSHTDADGTVVIPVYSTEHSHDIATVECSRNANVAHATARLIAAAPDLLSVVQRFVLSCQLAGVTPDEDSNDPFESLMASAVEALTKAAALRATGNGKEEG